MSNIHITSAQSLVTTSDARRNGFLEYALRRNKESIPYIDKGKALKSVLEAHTKKPSDILSITKIRESLLEASGISVKAKAHLTPADKEKILNGFIDEVLVPCGDKYIDEVVYRYLLTCGDALGGKMRNIVGSIAGEKFTRFIVSQLQVADIDFDFVIKGTTGFINGANFNIEIAESIKAIRWKTRDKETRFLAYNVNVPQVGKNIDIVLTNGYPVSAATDEVRKILTKEDSYLAIGELKGGIDPAGADEHWKTANMALSRVRAAFNQLPLFFIGAAIETAMAIEMYSQYNAGELKNAANLTCDNQLASLCEWFIEL